MSFLDSMSKEKRLYTKVKKQIGKARQHQERGQASQSLEEFQKAYQTMNEAKEVVATQKRDFSVLYDVIGNGLLSLDREQDGIKCIDRALALDPNNIKAIIHKGSHLFKQGDVSVPVFDTTYLHAVAAVDMALEKE